MKKYCSKCGELKRLSEFYKEKSGRDGRRPDCKECKNARTRRYHAKHRKEGNARQRRYNAKHREEQVAYSRQWQRDNPDKVAAKDRRYRARKVNAKGSHTANQWLDLCEYYDWRCVHCGVHHDVSPMTADHIVPLSRGGSDWIENIQPLCRSCNSRKGGR